MKNLILTTVFSLLIVSNVFAYDPIENTEIDVYEAYNHLTNTTFTDNAYLNYLQVNPDEFWTNQAGVLLPVSSSAGNQNTIASYDIGNYSSNTNVFSIPAGTFGYLGNGTTQPYNMYNITNNSDFGMLLKTTDTAGTAVFDSNTDANLGARDHFVVYQMPNLVGQTIKVNNNGNIENHTLVNPYLVSVEDRDLGDSDYNDAIYIMDGTTPYNANASMQNQINNINNQVTNNQITNINQQSQINSNSQHINDLNERVDGLERMDFVGIAKLRWIDTKKWEFENYVKYSDNRHGLSEVGVELTFKVGKSYTDKKLEDQEKRLQALENNQIKLTRAEVQDEAINKAYAEQNYNITTDGKNTTITRRF